MEKEVEEGGKKLNMTAEQIDKLKDAIGKAKKAAGIGKTIFDAVTAKGSILRKVVGDGAVDFAVMLVNEGSEAVLGPKQIATDFAPVNFESIGLFDIDSFAGVARTETRERIGAPTSVLLDFAARQNQSLLGFQAHVLMERRFSLSLTLGSFEISNGVLKPMPPDQKF
jgi:hypothetical protein